MSETLLLLDGDELEPLLVQARELGGRVVKAEKVRPGGLGAWFGAPRYEITVAAPGLTEAAAAEGGAPKSTAEHPAPARSGQPASRPTGLEALLQAADRAEGAAANPGSGEGAAAKPGSAEAVLAASWAETAARAAAERARRAGAAAAGSGTPPPASAAGPPASSATARAGASSSPAPAPPAPAPRARAASGTAAPAWPALRPAEPAQHTAPPATGVTETLHALGVPLELIGTEPAGPLRGNTERTVLRDAPRNADVEVVSALLHVAAALPAAPEPAPAPGSIVAVVGAPAEVHQTCTDLLLRLDGPGRVVLVGEDATGPARSERLTSRRRAARVRARAARRGEVVLVAVSVGRSRARRRRAESLLAELAPDRVWAVVDARRPVADLRADLAALPLDVDVLAAQQVAKAPRPGQLLELDLPVAALDGVPATPAVWVHALHRAHHWAGLRAGAAPGVQRHSDAAGVGG